MRLDYNILWIDNDLDDYVNNGSVQSIKDFLLDKGFTANIILVNDEANLETFLDREYDFIISDFNLNETNGDTIIYNLRKEREIATEIFFYSARTSFMEDEGVKEKMAFMERISFHFGRDDLMSKIEDAILLTLKKLLDINATRGLITAETSELDVIIEDITIEIQTKLLKKSDDELSDIISNYANGFLAKSSERFISKYKKIGFVNSIKFMEANRKWKLFRTSLKEYNKIKNNGEIKSFLNHNKTYFDDVIDVRNKFAHAKSEDKDGKLVLKAQYGSEDFLYDENTCIEIRKKLITHRNNIEELNKILKQ